MNGWSAVAVVLSLLLAPQSFSSQPLPGGSPQATTSGTQQPGSMPQTGATQSPNTPQEQQQPPAPARPRTPREDEELRADILMARKQYSEASAIYTKLLRQEPGNAVLLNKLGVAYHQEGKLDLAKRYYERSSKADRTYANAVNNVGTIYYQRKKYRKAIQNYQKALALNPDMATVHSNLGYAYFADKRYEEALDSFHRALGLDSTIFERTHSGGTLLQDRSVTDPGLFYFFLAKSFARMGDAKRCAQYLRKSRDEGYKGLAAAQKDPAFAGVLNDPEVREILQLPSPVAEAPKSLPGC
jgi:tetratricopeptide (TPR) repeat protein